MISSFSTGNLPVVSDSMLYGIFQFKCKYVADPKEQTNLRLETQIRQSIPTYIREGGIRVDGICLAQEVCETAIGKQPGLRFDIIWRKVYGTAQSVVD